MPKDRLVSVDWDDTCSNSRWVVRENEDIEPIQCHSIGYLLKKTPKKIIIYATKTEQGDISERSCIPRGCIRKIRYLKEPK